MYIPRRRALGLFRLAVSLFFFVQGLVFASWANRIPDIKDALQLGEAQLGSLLFAIPLGQVSAIVLSAWLVNRFSSRRMLSIAAVLYPLFLLPLGLASNSAQMALGLFLFGMSANLYNTCSNTQGVNVEAVYGSNIMGSLHGFWSLGSFAGGLLSMILIGAGLNPWQHFAVILVAAVLLNVATRRLLIKTDRKATSRGVTVKGIGYSEADSGCSIPAATTGLHGWRRLDERLDEHVLWLGGIAFCAEVCEGCMFDWSGVFFREVVHAPHHLTQLGYVVCLCTMATGRFVSDHLIMRFGARRVVGVSSALVVAGMTAAALFPYIVPATLAFLVTGFGISATVPLCYSLAGRCTSMNSGTAIATVSSVAYVGFLVGPPAIGHIAAAVSLRWTFPIVALAAVVVALAARSLPGRVGDRD